MTCPRCNGRMALDGDKYGRYWACYHCGKHIDCARDGTPLSPLARVNDVILPVPGSGVVR